eukprot:Protomagalhaensia_wolfi_Nauph_80__753@NODE_1432_length_1536_cov_4_373413_g1106_i0_p1_GENE_NODE_1432_length_1536_cov_4_373413_g1106_i0NODE_1432_length_1536_cov_4_373413_g1106_i0_p1_ORF_typecomplete_len221_score36_57_NODE_1432_length_1536_cov_4_373413_g1106_i07581420
MQNRSKMLGSRTCGLFQFLHQRDLRLALRQWNQVTLQDKLDRTNRYQHLIAKLKKGDKVSPSHTAKAVNEPPMSTIPPRSLSLPCKFLVRVVDQALQKRHHWAWSRLLRLLEGENLRPAQRGGPKAVDYTVNEEAVQAMKNEGHHDIVIEKDGRRVSNSSSSISQKRFTLVESGESVDVVDGGSPSLNGFEKENVLAVLRFKGTVVTGQARSKFALSGVT